MPAGAVVPPSLTVAVTVLVVEAFSEGQIGSWVVVADCRATKSLLTSAAVKVSQPGHVVTPSSPTVTTSSRCRKAVAVAGVDSAMAVHSPKGSFAGK